MSKMLHLDLFSGIGGFAYAADQVFGDVEHIFCDNDKFCQQVLKKHWPESEIYDDIRTITADSLSKRRKGGVRKTERRNRLCDRNRQNEKPFLLTGGFPCQPFSAAGLRRGTADDRHLWPEMLRVIRLTKPTWVIAENVRGLLTWNEGLVFEQVCADLEAEGYEVQPFIIPAVAVDAPHRRDRVWFVANSRGRGFSGSAIGNEQSGRSQTLSTSQSSKYGNKGLAPDITHSPSDRRTGRRPPATVEEGYTAQPRTGGQLSGGFEGQDSWDKDWAEVATELCGVDDGLPAELDGFKLTNPQHRKERLKSLGNAIVPQVAMEIMESIKHSSVEGSNK